MDIDVITREIIGSAIEVHKHWGPGLYEEIYQKSLCRELLLRKIPFVSQMQMPLLYKGESVGNNLRLQRPGSKKRHQTNGALALPLLLPLFSDLQEGLREFGPRHARRSLGEGGYSVAKIPATLVFFSSAFSVSLCL